MSETPSGARARASPGPAAAPSASPLHQGRRGPDLAAAAASSPGSRADRRTRPAGVGVAAAASPSSGCPRLPSAPHAAPAAATTAAGERCAQGACAVYVELGRAALRKAGEDTARVDGGTCVLGLLGDRSERRTDAHLPAAWALARGRLGRGGERSQPGRPTVGGARGMCRKVSTRSAPPPILNAGTREMLKNSQILWGLLGAMAGFTRVCPRGASLKFCSRGHGRIPGLM